MVRCCGCCSRAPPQPQPEPQPEPQPQPQPLLQLQLQLDPYQVPRLQEQGALPAQWRLLSAAPTYNPLGRLNTFITAAEISSALRELTQARTPAQAPQPVDATGATAAAGAAEAGAAAVSPLAADRRHTVAAAAAPPPQPPLRALLICPGRGSYNSSELGSLGRLARRDAWAPIVEDADARSNPKP